MTRPDVATIDSDVNIRVYLTDDDELYCIALVLPGVAIKMHTRSAIDLHRKLGLAIMDWITDVTELQIMQS